MKVTVYQTKLRWMRYKVQTEFWWRNYLDVDHLEDKERELEGNNKMDFKSYEIDCEDMDETNYGSCSVVGFCFSGVETSRSTIYGQHSFPDRSFGIFLFFIMTAIVLRLIHMFTRVFYWSLS